jgi:glycosyltransferase involved in cell wall biosynthesis
MVLDWSTIGVGYMRLLFVHDRLGAMAGAEVNAYATALEFQNRGHSLGLIHGFSTGKSENDWRDVFTGCFPLGKTSNFEIVQRAVREFSPDVIYVHKMADLDVLEALADADCAVVRMVHDHDLYCLRSYKYFPLTRKICTHAVGVRCIFPCGGVLGKNSSRKFPVEWKSYRAKKRELELNRQFDRMVVATEYMKQELLRNGFNSSRIEIHAPVPHLGDDCPQSRFSERNVIVYAGQIIRGKGVDVLIEALAQVQVPFECVILGEGNHRPYCEKLSRRLGLAGKIQFKGYVPPVDLEQFYREASVAVVSSVWPEPFGAVGLEAMRRGLPVVAFDAGGIKEWLLDGQNGYLVPWMNRHQFAVAVERLLRNKDLAKSMGSHGRQFVREKFHFAGYISRLEQMFERVIHDSEPIPA